MRWVYLVLWISYVTKVADSFGSVDSGGMVWYLQKSDVSWCCTGSILWVYKKRWLLGWLGVSISSHMIRWIPGMRVDLLYQGFLRIYIQPTHITFGTKMTKESIDSNPTLHINSSTYQTYHLACVPIHLYKFYGTKDTRTAFVILEYRMLSTKRNKHYI